MQGISIHLRVVQIQSCAAVMPCHLDDNIFKILIGMVADKDPDEVGFLPQFDTDPLEIVCDVFDTVGDFGFTTLAECDFPWQLGRTYAMELRCEGTRITLSVDGREMLTAEDTAFAYGMFGCGSTEMGRTSFGDFTFRDL